MEINADFHIHSRYSGATSKNMEFPVIARQAELKGLNLVGTGDALHGKWLNEIKKLEKYGEGIYALGETKFIITLEVEDSRRVHHCAILPDISCAESLREVFSKYSNLDIDGRPHLSLKGDEIAEIISDAGGLIGPGHAFVPWTSVYKEYDSIDDCYGSAVKRVRFIELGLSADTDMADTIEELQNLTFLSNSDAHSPWPNKLGREFNRLEVNDITFKDISLAIERRKGRSIVLNVGFDPQMGKYHRSACIKCYNIYNLEEAQRLKWKCSKCGGRIKKGVKDRIKEIATWDEPMHPYHRPEYIKIVPLSEIIASALGVNFYSKKVQTLWNKLVSKFGSEIAVLIDESFEDIAVESGEAVAAYIISFRMGDFRIREGGGGRYGEIIFNFKEKVREKTGGIGQRSLDSF